MRMAMSSPVRRKNSIADREDTPKRKGAQPINHVASHQVTQKPPIPPPTPK